MANSRYKAAWNLFAQGRIAWRSQGGSTIRAMFIDALVYRPSTATDSMLSDIPVNARIGNGGLKNRQSAPALELIDPVDGGVCDAEDIVFHNIPVGTNIDYLILFADVGKSDSTSPLIAILDAAVGLPVVANGEDISVTWDNGPNKILRL